MALTQGKRRVPEGEEEEESAEARREEMMAMFSSTEKGEKEIRLNPSHLKISGWNGTATKASNWITNG